MTLLGRYQDWKFMVLVWLFLTLLLSYFAINYTWQIGTRWHPFEYHLLQWLQIVKGYIFHKTSDFNTYNNYLVNNDLISHFWIHLIIPILICSIFGGFLAFKFIYVEGGIDLYKYKSGIRLLPNKQAVRYHKRKLVRKNLKFALPLHPLVYLPLHEQLGNIFISGSQGSGKSTVLKPILNAIFQYNRHALVYDAKLEYTQLFYKKSIILINPFDTRSACWDIGKDIDSELSARNVAEAFIKESKDPFWSDGAREVLIGILLSLNNTIPDWTWQDLNSHLSISIDKLQELVSNYHPRARVFVEKDSKMTQSLLAYMSTQLSWINVVSEYWKDNNKHSFSVNQWVESELTEHQVIIPNIPNYSHVSSPVCAALLSLTANRLLSQEDNDRQFWFVLDELADLPKTKSLINWLSKGRSKGGHTVAATQAQQQLRSKYGDDAETLLSLFSNNITLRTNSYESASKLSKNIGNRTVELQSMNYDKDGNVSTSTQEKELPAVTAEQIMHLPTPSSKGVTGFLTLAGYKATYLLTWPYPQLNPIAEGFIAKGIEQPDISPTNRRGARGRNRAC
ncbi:type IV secretion system DNA-binding domain-containing protein [Paraglaciecola aquimarina]|uniref:Type IV secretion system DNA-binding domain-containing protein n=1 Tax=Paraglaciecola aquimarina TaxID=1235557 RepID=A0ABU3SUZ6_9ALTE|nr:type IV secretion system DNA-binding domain-containing protein [Paraglaciecola aquimarina]MDU0353829.1 type IV secretion system DNA-binding domain-containing protein [Paraglaciecola aquimarina]